MARKKNAVRSRKVRGIKKAKASGRTGGKKPSLRKQFMAMVDRIMDKIRLAYPLPKPREIHYVDWK